MVPRRVAESNCEKSLSSIGSPLTLTSKTRPPPGVATTLERTMRVCETVPTGAWKPEFRSSSLTVDVATASIASPDDDVLLTCTTSE